MKINSNPANRPAPRRRRTIQQVMNIPDSREAPPTSTERHRKTKERLLERLRAMRLDDMNINYGGLTIRIEQDEDPENPQQEWDQLGRLATWHPDYCFGNEEPSESPQKFLAALPKGTEVLTVCLLDHSGLHVWIGHGPHWLDSQGWESGPVGYIYCTPDKIRKEYSCRRISPEVRANVREVLTAEIEALEQYLTGEVYGFTVEDRAGNTLDSCSGCFGYDYCLKCAKESADQCLAEA